MLRTLLILGRVSNLPTVWSNLLTGWILVGDIDPRSFVFLLCGGSFLYIGGMYLNDFCDASFDARYCPQRPIPAGKISRRAVGLLALLWFAGGFACLIQFEWSTIEVALLLVAAIVLYDFHHKNVFWAPLVMGFCRFLLYPLGAAVAVSPRILWWGIPPSVDPNFLISTLLPAASLGLYVAGITYLARGESRPEKPTRWALILLLFPLLLSVGMCILRPDRYDRSALYWLPHLGWVAWFLFFGWVAWILIPFWNGKKRSIGRVVSGLLAGIVLVDQIAAYSLWDLNSAWACSYLAFFLLALLLQRIIPAT